LGKEGVTTGASNDIQRATSFARNMVAKWGLTDELGPLLYDDEESDPFNRGYGQGAKPLAEETQRRIDSETRRIIDECYKKAEQILVDNRDILETMCQALMKYETIDSKQIDQLMNREAVSAPDGWVEDDDKSDDQGTATQEADTQTTAEEQDDQTSLDTGSDEQGDKGVDPDVPHSPDNNVH